MHHLHIEVHASAVFQPKSCSGVPALPLLCLHAQGSIHGTRAQSTTLPTARICTISSAEQTFCNQAVETLNLAAGAQVTFTCVQGTSTSACAADIAAGRSDLRLFGATDAYSAFKTHNLQALVAEDYGKGAVEYDSVAVVRKSFCDRNPNANFGSLRGARSCHTGTPFHVVPHAACSFLLFGCH